MGCRPDLLTQLASFSRALGRKNFYVDDCHACNWMWIGPRLVSIDGELYSPMELIIHNILLRNLDSRIRGFMPLPGCDRCFHWLDGPRVTMKQILEGRLFNALAPLEWRADFRNKTYPCFDVFKGREALTLETQALMEQY